MTTELERLNANFVQGIALSDADIQYLFDAIGKLQAENDRLRDALDDDENEPLLRCDKADVCCDASCYHFSMHVYGDGCESGYCDDADVYATCIPVQGGGE